MADFGQAMRALAPLSFQFLEKHTKLWIPASSATGASLEWRRNYLRPNGIGEVLFSPGGECARRGTGPVAALSRQIANPRRSDRAWAGLAAVRAEDCG